MHSLVMTRVYQMAKSTNTELTDKHLEVLDFTWRYYRQNRVGPLGNNIKRNTGLTIDELENMFPNGLSSVYTWVGVPIQSTRAGCKPMALLEVEDPREVYFDHNATTPVRKEVIDALVKFYSDQGSFGNPSSAYVLGGQAYDVIDQARRQIANSLGVDPEEIFFTGSGSEANNLAIKGIADAHSSGHIITSNVEHPSVFKTMQHLQEKGFEVTYLPVDTSGMLSAEQVETSIRQDTFMVCIMAANNEIGTIYPVQQIGDICKSYKIPYVVDAIQAYGKFPLSPRQFGIDILTLSGHKIYAPKGVGAIYIRKGLKLVPLIHGGSQEQGVRAGTENVAGILALGLAGRLANNELRQATAHFAELRNHFLERLRQSVPDAIVNGSLENRLPHNLSVGFPGVDSGSLLLSFNQIGIYVSAGSACSAGDEKISHVLAAINADASRYGTIRFSFGQRNSLADIDYLFDHLPEILKQLQPQPAIVH